MSEAEAGDATQDGADKAQRPAPANQGLLLRQRTEYLLAKATSGDLSAEESRWIEDVYRLTAIKSRLPDPARRSGLLGHALLALTCAVLAGLLLMVRVGDLSTPGFLSTNNISIHLRCRAFAATLTESVNHSIIGTDIWTDQLEISPLDTIAVSNASFAFHEPDLRLDVRAERIFLESVEFDPGSRLDVRPLDGRIVLNTNAERLRVKATFQMAEFSEPVKQSVRSKEELGIPLFARFESLNKERSNLRIAFRQLAPVSMLAGSRISALELSDSDVFGADTLVQVSTVQSGAVILDDVGRTVSIHNRDALVLQGLEGWITDVKIEDGSVDLFVKGTAKSIRAGPARSGADVSPRLLEYFYKNQPFALLWGSMVFLWGLLRSVAYTIK
jgi:hypothetical protein